MSTPLTNRRLTRSRQSVNYQESPEEPRSGVRKSARKSLLQNRNNDRNDGTSDEDKVEHLHKRTTRKSLLPKTPVKGNVQDENDSPVVLKRKSRGKKTIVDYSSSDEEPEIVAKTPKIGSKSARKAEAEPSEFSPKKLRRNRAMSEKGLEAIVNESSPTIAKIDTTPRSRSAKRKEQRSSGINLRIDLRNKTVEKVKRKPETIDVSSESSDIEDLTSEKVEKPTTLFIENEDVEGGALYSFKTPKKKDSMALLAQQHTPKTPHRGTPKTPKTPRLSEVMKTPTSRPSALTLAKTPKHIRADTKKKLTKRSLAESSEEELSGDESESEDSSDSSDGEDEDPSPAKKPIPVATRLLKTPSVASTRQSARIRGDYNFVLQSDDYFSSASTKAKTSNHTLDRLKNPRLPHDQLIRLLSNMKLSKEHEVAVKSLNGEYKNYFDKWLTLFDQGFTVLLHGFGSKINLLQSFHKEKLAERNVVVINGFFPSLTIKDILDSIWVNVLEQHPVGGNPHEIVNLIEQDMKEIPALHLFLIVHNIDGNMLRNNKAQSVLSRLASIKNLHMIASIDHINAPLLWNNTKLSNYNFAWFDVTSFLPYTEETLFEDSLLVQNSGALELSSMKSVFQSLTSNARGIYKLIMNYQLKNRSNANYQGMSFKDLYSSCRETFLVSSDAALRAQMTEFLDHKLAKMKRAVDGSENVIIPIKNHLLEQFLNEQN